MSKRKFNAGFFKKIMSVKWYLMVFALTTIIYSACGVKGTVSTSTGSKLNNHAADTASSKTNTPKK